MTALVKYEDWARWRLEYLMIFLVQGLAALGAIGREIDRGLGGHD